MKKILFLFLFACLFAKPAIAGNDITITCNTGSSCTKSSELPLFYETNIYPGFTHSQIFSVDNNRNGACHLKFKATSTSPVPDLLSTKILINIAGTNNDYSLVNYPLNDLLDPAKPLVSLGHVNKNVKNNYLWSVVFNSNAGNEYQNLVSRFDINFNFECDEDITDNPSNTSDNPPSNQGTADCTNSAPNAPTGLYAVRNDGSVTLHWTHPTSTHTGYLIAYGTSPGVYLYGAPDIGNDDHYTVGSLTNGAQYCFYVRSLNGCMPGGRTPEYCVNPGATIIPASIVPTGFEPNILGSSATTAECQKYWFPFLFLIAFVINLILVTRVPSYGLKLLLPLIPSILAFIIDTYLLQSRCCWWSPFFCRYFWVGNIFSYLLPQIFFSRSK